MARTISANNFNTTELIFWECGNSSNRNKAIVRQSIDEKDISNKALQKLISQIKISDLRMELLSRDAVVDRSFLHSINLLGSSCHVDYKTIRNSVEHDSRKLRYEIEIKAGLDASLDQILDCFSDSMLTEYGFKRKKKSLIQTEGSTTSDSINEELDEILQNIINEFGYISFSLSVTEENTSKRNTAGGDVEILEVSDNKDEEDGKYERVKYRDGPLIINNAIEFNRTQVIDAKSEEVLYDSLKSPSSQKPWKLKPVISGRVYKGWPSCYVVYSEGEVKFVPEDIAQEVTFKTDSKSEIANLLLPEPPKSPDEVRKRLNNQDDEETQSLKSAAVFPSESSNNLSVEDKRKVISQKNRAVANVPTIEGVFEASAIEGKWPVTEEKFEAPTVDTLSNGLEVRGNQMRGVLTDSNGVVILPLEIHDVQGSDSINGILYSCEHTTGSPVYFGITQNQDIVFFSESAYKIADCFDYSSSGGWKKLNELITTKESPISETDIKTFLEDRDYTELKQDLPISDQTPSKDLRSVLSSQENA